MQKPDIFEALRPVKEAFDRLSIPYFIGGSIASSIYGIARATMDIDLVAHIKNEHISFFKDLLQDKYYIDETMISEAIKRRSSFNLIHLDTMIKIDVFIFKDDPYNKEVLQRKRRDILDEDEKDIEFYFSSPEDIILNKLQWYQMGQEVSERQWLDVVGVIKVQGSQLDRDYLDKWAKKLKLHNLLNKAYRDAGFS